MSFSEPHQPTRGFKAVLFLPSPFQGLDKLIVPSPSKTPFIKKRRSSFDNTFSSGIEQLAQLFLGIKPNCLQSLSSLTQPSNDNKPDQLNPYFQSDRDNKSMVLLDLIQNHIQLFSGDTNARQWFIQLDSKFAELKLSFHDRLQVLPHFFVGDAIT